MSRRAALILNISIAVAVVAYLVLAIDLWQTKQTSIKCKEVRVRVIDSSPYQFVNDSVVKSWLSQAAISTLGSSVSDIDLFSIESTLRQHYFVDSCQAYTSMDGTLRIDISQAVPLVRIMSNHGYDFYVDSTLQILPIEAHFRADVPIINGNINFEFPLQYTGALDEKKYEIDKEYLKNFINFVKCIDADDFLQNLIVQIYVNDVGDIELIPRLGSQIILFGGIINCDEKLGKLKKFYQKSLSEQWWLKAKIINLKYKNQVIVT